MSTAVQLVAQADALLEDVDLSTAHPDLASLLAAYRASKEAGNPAGWIVARAVVRCADRVGVAVEAATGGPSLGDLTVAELKAEIERRNEGRDEAELIVPEGTKKAALVAALEADDARE